MAATTSLSMLIIIMIILAGRGGKIVPVVLLAAVVLLSNSGRSSSAPAQEYYPEEESQTEEPAAAVEELMLPELPEYFTFSSGAGGWATELHMDRDGYFSGSYHDSEMGLSGDDYDATVYVCNFYGKFTVEEKIDEYTYALRLDWIDQSETNGETWIEDRVQYIGSSPYGLDDVDQLMLYLPGRTTEDLTEECVSWIYMAEGWSWDERGSTLSGYVLYNVNAGEAFTGSY